MDTELMEDFMKFKAEILPFNKCVTRITTSDGKPHEHFWESTALGWLMLKEVCHMWWDEDERQLGIYVKCNDVFAWACSDSEPIHYNEIRELYDFVLKDEKWGSTMWCVKKRKEMPQPPCVDLIEKSGIWDFQKLKTEWELQENYYAANCKKIFSKGKS